MGLELGAAQLDGFRRFQFKVSCEVTVEMLAGPAATWRLVWSGGGTCKMAHSLWPPIGYDY